MFEKYLIQPSSIEPPPSLMAKATKHLIIGHLVVQWVPLYFFYDFFVYLGMPPFYSRVNWLHLFYFVPFMVLCDTLLYWSHRTLHHPLLYVRFHKQHHEFKSNVPFASEYFTMTEEIFTGFIPTLAVSGTAFLLIDRVRFSFDRILSSSSSGLLSASVSRAMRTVATTFPFPHFALGVQATGTISITRTTWVRACNILCSHLGNFSAFFCFWDRVCGTDEAYNNYKRNQKLKAENSDLAY